MKKKVFFILPLIFGLTSCGILSKLSIADYDETKIINQSVSVENFKYNVIEFMNATRIGTIRYNINTENNFIFMNIEIENVTNEEHTVYSNMIVYHMGEKKYTPENTGFEDTLCYSETINAGLKKNLYLIFETPEKAHKTDFLEFKGSTDKIEPQYIYMNWAE